MDNTGSLFSMTCKLIDNLVVVCGDEWLECHGEEEVRRMKEMQVEYLIVKNRGADQVDIEQCTIVQQFRLDILSVFNKLQSLLLERVMKIK